MSEPLRILILEDRPNDAELIQFELEEAGFVFTSKVVMTGKDFISEIQEFSPDLILSDYDLPAYNGALALSEAKSRCPDTPFILVTGAVTEDRAIEILTQGAKDYVLKTRLEQRLAPAIRRALAEVKEQRARKQAEQDLLETNRTLEERVKTRTAELEAEITARKKLEEALRESERHERERADELATIIDAIPTPILIVHDPDANHITGNIAADELLRQPEGAEASLSAPSGMRPRHFKAVKDGRELNVDELPAQRAARGEQIRDFEFSLVFNDGAVRHVLGYGTPLLDDRHQSRGAVHVLVDVTERKQTEEQLQASEERYRELVNSSPEAVIVHRDGQFIYANPAALRLYGAESLLQLQSRTVLDLTPDNERRSIASRMKQGMAGERLSLRETKMMRLDGQVISVESVGGAVTYDGEPAVQMMIRDITERKQVEEILKESEKKYRELVKYAPIGIYEIDFLNRKFLTVNESMILLSGYTREELLAMDPLNILADESKNAFLTRIGRMLRGERPDEEVEYKVITKDGHVINAVLSMSFRFDEHGKPVGAAVIGYDITERKQAEELLRESEERYKSLVKYAPAAIYETDLQGTKFFSVNKAMCSILGYSQEELLLIKPIDLLDEESRSIFRERIRKNREGEKIDETIEYRIRRKDGEWINVAVNYGSYTYANKETIGVVVIAYDITDQKRAEILLEERTQELENINRELESFSYSVSHDLKAPLRAINGYSRMLLKKNADSLSGDTISKLDAIRSNTEKMTALIDDLLSFSKVQKTSLVISEIDMNKLVKEVWDEIKAANTEREIELKIKDILPGKGDRSLIRQVLFNLLSNAVKFTKDRKPAIIELNSYSESDRIVYSIKDNGAGFAMEYYDKLFGVFQRLHSHEEYEGTGIGLAIVQRIVKRHGGNVWAEGKVDNGATFCFSLPAKQT